MSGLTKSGSAPSISPGSRRPRGLRSSASSPLPRGRRGFGSVQVVRNCWSRTSKRPRAVIRSSGMTGRARNESVPNGAASGQPSDRAARWTSSSWSQTVSASAVESRPATGRGRRAPDLAADRGHEAPAATRPGPGRRRACRGGWSRPRSGCASRGPPTTPAPRGGTARGRRPAPGRPARSPGAARCWRSGRRRRRGRTPRRRPRPRTSRDLEPGDDLVGDDPDHRAGRRGQRAAGRPTRRSGRSGSCSRGAIGGRRVLGQVAAVAGHDPAILDDHPDVEVDQVVDHDQVGPVARARRRPGRPGRNAGRGRARRGGRRPRAGRPRRPAGGASRRGGRAGGGRRGRCRR